MEKSNASGGGPERDRLRLDMIRQSDPASFSEEKMNFLTFNLDKTAAECHPHPHHQGNIGSIRTVKRLLHDHPRISKNLKWLMMDYLLLPAAYIRNTVESFAKVTFKEFVAEEIIGPDTQAIFPNFRPYEGSARDLKTSLELLYMEGIKVTARQRTVFLKIDALTREDAKQQFPLYAATEKMSGEELAQYTNEKETGYLKLSSDSPFFRVTLVDHLPKEEASEVHSVAAAEARAREGGPPPSTWPEWNIRLVIDYVFHESSNLVPPREGRPFGEVFPDATTQPAPPAFVWSFDPKAWAEASRQHGTSMHRQQPLHGFLTMSLPPPYHEKDQKIASVYFATAATMDNPPITRDVFESITRHGMSVPNEITEAISQVGYAHYLLQQQSPAQTEFNHFRSSGLIQSDRTAAVLQFELPTQPASGKYCQPLFPAPYMTAIGQNHPLWLGDPTAWYALSKLNDLHFATPYYRGWINTRGAVPKEATISIGSVVRYPDPSSGKMVEGLVLLTSVKLSNKVFKLMLETLKPLRVDDDFIRRLEQQPYVPVAVCYVLPLPQLDVNSVSKLTDKKLCEILGKFVEENTTELLVVETLSLADVIPTEPIAMMTKRALVQGHGQLQSEEIQVPDRSLLWKNLATIDVWTTLAEYITVTFDQMKKDRPEVDLEAKILASARDSFDISIVQRLHNLITLTEWPKPRPFYGYQASDGPPATPASSGTSAAVPAIPVQPPNSGGASSTASIRDSHESKRCLELLARLSQAEPVAAHDAPFRGALESQELAKRIADTVPPPVTAEQRREVLWKWIGEENKKLQAYLKFHATQHSSIEDITWSALEEIMAQLDRANGKWSEHDAAKRMKNGKGWAKLVWAPTGKRPPAPVNELAAQLKKIEDEKLKEREEAQRTIEALKNKLKIQQEKQAQADAVAKRELAADSAKKEKGSAKIKQELTANQKQAAAAVTVKKEQIVPEVTRTSRRRAIGSDSASTVAHDRAPSAGSTTASVMVAATTLSQMTKAQQKKAATKRKQEEAAEKVEEAKRLREEAEKPKNDRAARAAARNPEPAPVAPVPQPNSRSTGSSRRAKADTETQSMPALEPVSTVATEVTSTDFESLIAKTAEKAALAATAAALAANAQKEAEKDAQIEDLKKIVQEMQQQKRSHHSMENPSGEDQPESSNKKQKLD
ncbi:MAG: hypothetical protein P4L67_02905, partial [Candidatus Pacebacteria bacterium]|nr:hypothetical protein [Candidatus Paceibacterota bacterium]